MPVVSVHPSMYDTIGEVLRNPDGNAAMDLTKYAAVINATMEGAFVRCDIDVTNISDIMLQPPALAVPAPWNYDAGHALGAHRLTGTWDTVSHGKWQRQTKDAFFPFQNRLYQSSVNAHTALATAFDANGSVRGNGSFAVMFSYDKLAILLTIDVGGKPYVILKMCPNEGFNAWQIVDLMSPGETKRFTFWVTSSASSMNLESSLDAVQPYIDNRHATIDKAGEVFPHWPGGRITGHILAVDAHDADPDHRYYQPNNGVRVDQCANLAEVFQSWADRYGGIATIKSRGYRAVQFWGINGFVPGRGWPTASMSKMPEHLLTYESKLSGLRWMEENRFPVRLYFSYALWLYQDKDAAWDSPELLGYEGAYSYSGHLLSFTIPLPPTDPAEYKPQRAFEQTRQFWEENHFEAAKWFFGIHFDGSPDANQFLWARPVIKSVRQRFPHLFTDAETAPRTDIDMAGFPAYWFGVNNSGYQGKCPLMQRIHGEDYHHVVQIDGINNTDSANQIALVEANGGTPIIVGNVTSFPISENTFYKSSEAAWDAWFDAEIARKFAALEAPDPFVIGLSPITVAGINLGPQTRPAIELGPKSSQGGGAGPKISDENGELGPVEVKS